MKMFLTFITLTCLTSRYVVQGENREHKVHNIVLYPERHEWCQTTAIKQIIAMPGYEPVTIDNNVCVGACFSYSIPRSQPAEPGELIGPYCDSCQPQQTKCYHVTLKASSNGTKTAQKRVQIITNCSCSSCGNNRAEDCEIADRNTSELPPNLFVREIDTRTKVETEEIPELLNLNPANQTRPPALQNARHFPRYEINSKIIALLKSIQNEEEDSNINYDKQQLKELLAIIEGSEHQLSDKNLMDFVNFINVHNSEDLELDLSHLKEVLIKFREEQEVQQKKQQLLLEKHRDFGIGLDLEALALKNNEKIQADLTEIPQKYAIKNFGVEETHVTHHRHKARINEFEGNSLESKPNIGHHHLGETQETEVHHLGHLTRGPHGSLVLSPDLKIEEKLNLDSEEVRPNHEGVVLSYENHHTKTHRKISTN